MLYSNTIFHFVFRVVDNMRVGNGISLKESRESKPTKVKPVNCEKQQRLTTISAN